MKDFKTYWKEKASDMVIKPAYHLAWLNMASPSDFGLPEGQHYEWYATRLNGLDLALTLSSKDEGNGTEENSEQQGQGQGQSEEKEKGDEQAESTTGWGSLLAGMIELIKKSTG